MQAILEQCTNVLPGHGPSRSMKEIFQSLAAALAGDEFLDTYGAGPELANFEAEIAALFGKEAAVFLPTGTMAQQIALRIWCEQQHNFTVAMHPTAHLEYAEQLGYQFLHHILRLQFGAPEFVSNRTLTVQDFAQLGTKPGVILIELPYRPLGGQLPSWEELLAIRAWAKERGIPLHMDGARIWQCQPFYQHTYQEIAALFDSLYVSFYKDLGGLGGAMLLGSTSCIDEARQWQIRHGGRLRTMGPFWLSAQLGVKQVLPQIDQWVAKAQEVAAILSRFDRITINPNPPHVNFFQLYIRGDAEQLNNRHLALAEETGTFLFNRLNSTNVPGVAVTEIHCWENSLRFRVEELEPFVQSLLSANDAG
ncbi:MAG: aminotransferase class I/II-fold pyridoxal phosphate-dependent enzyme [Caldilineaceae bacterium]